MKYIQVLFIHACILGYTIVLWAQDSQVASTVPATAPASQPATQPHLPASIVFDLKRGDYIFVGHLPATQDDDAGWVPVSRSFIAERSHGDNWRLEVSVTRGVNEKGEPMWQLRSAVQCQHHDDEYDSAMSSRWVDTELADSKAKQIPVEKIDVSKELKSGDLRVYYVPYGEVNGKTRKIIVAIGTKPELFSGIIAIQKSYHLDWKLWPWPQ